MSGQCAWFMTDLATEPDHGAIHLSGTPAGEHHRGGRVPQCVQARPSWKPGANRGSLRAHATHCVGRSARSARS